MKGGGQRCGDQQNREAGHERIAEPLHVAKQVVDALADRQAAAVPRKQELPPMQAKDLNAAERPAEALLLQTARRPLAPSAKGAWRQASKRSRPSRSRT